MKATPISSPVLARIGVFHHPLATTANHFDAVRLRALAATTAENLTTTGGGNFIQNTTTPQASANFNINGNGTAVGTLSVGTVNTTTQYNIGGARMLSAPGGDNAFVGKGAGQENSGVRNRTRTSGATTFG